MRVICAWCNQEIKADDGSGLPDSHGICPACADRYYPKPPPGEPGKPMQPPAPPEEKPDEM